MLSIILNFLSKLHLWSPGICCKTQEKNKCSWRHISSLQYDTSSTPRQHCVLEKETGCPEPEFLKGYRKMKEFIGKGKVTLMSHRNKPKRKLREEGWYLNKP